MPFQYEGWQNPYGASIADEIARSGDAHARAAAIIGQAQARAAEQRGQAWAGAASNIGATVAAIPGEMARAKTLAQEQAISDLQLKDVRARQAGQAQLDTLMQGDQLPPGDAGPRQESYTDATGLFDVPKLTQALAQGGYGHLAPELLKGAEAINDSITKHQAAEAQAAQAKTILVGDLADGALKLTKLGMPVPDAMDFVVQPALATQRIQPQEYAQIRQHIASLPPEQQQAALGTFMDAAAKLGGGKTLGKDAEELDRYGRVIASNVVPEKPTEATLDAAYQTLIAKRAKGQTLTPDEEAEVKAYETRKPPPQTSNEWKDVLLDGKPAKVFVDPKTKVVTDLSGQTITDPIARIKPIPPASITIHNEKEKTGATNRAELVDGVIKGDIAPSQLSRRADDYNVTLADARKRYKELTGKDLSIAKLETDYQAAKKFISSMNSDKMVRYRGLSESVVNTINEVQRLGDLLQQGGVQKWNSVTRGTIRQVYGNTPESELANQYVGAVNTLKEEFANLANGGYAPTDSAWKLANDQINANFGFKDLRASLTEVQRLINYRTQAFNEQHAFTGSGDVAPPSAPAPAASGPDLSGLAAGHGRTFSEGPYKGQTWTLGPDGHAVRVH